MMYRMARAAASGLLVLIILLGSVSQAMGQGRTGAAMAAQQTFRIGFTPGAGWGEGGLDPQLTAYGADISLDEMLFGGLMKADVKGVPQLDMATGYTLSADKRTYTFTLRHGMRFGDGTPITAQDFIWSWNHLALNPASVASAYMTDIEGVDQVLAGKATSVSGISAPDDYTVRVTTTHPASYFLSLMAYPAFDVLEKANVLAGTKKSPWINHAVASGMYALQQYKPGVSITLVPNHYYYGLKLKITKVIGTFLGTNQTQLVAYENNEFDIMFPAAQDVRHFIVPGGPHHDELITVDKPHLVGLGVRTKEAPTDDIHVRQALSDAIDTNLLSQAILGGMYPAAHRMLWANPFFPMLPINGTKYDPAEARKQLAMSKYGSDPSKYPTIKFLVPTASGGGDWPRMAEAMQQMWQQNLGLNVKIITTQATYLAQAQKAQLSINDWWNDYEDPQEMFHMVGNGKGGIYASYWVGNPKYAWDDPTFDKLDAEQASSFDPQARARLFAQMDQIWTDSASWIPLYWQRFYVLKKPWVQGWTMLHLDIIPFVQASTWIAAH
jgi:ABC-type oligopeptide transport system substrate-binding subunit